MAKCERVIQNGKLFLKCETLFPKYKKINGYDFEFDEEHLVYILKGTKYEPEKEEAYGSFYPDELVDPDDEEDLL